jgi:hypothetical protein
MVKRKLLASVAMGPLLALFGGAEANAQQTGQLPAVAYPNFTLGAYGGSAFGYGYGQLEGTFAAPLGANFGTQFDGAVGTEDGAFSSHAAGQIFWRNPATALFGLYGAYDHLDDGFTPDAARLGAESELYLSRFTLSGIVGVDFDNSDKIFAQARAYYYLDDNTKFFGGYVLDDAGSLGQQVNAGAVGFEHLFPSSGISIFGEARAGDHDYRAAWAGIKFYLGGPSANTKSLLGRDREDVAPVWRFIEEKRQKVASSTSATSTTGTTTSTTSTSTSTSTTGTTATSTSFTGPS